MVERLLIILWGEIKETLEGLYAEGKVPYPTIGSYSYVRISPEFDEVVLVEEDRWESCHDYYLVWSTNPNTKKGH